MKKPVGFADLVKGVADTRSPEHIWQLAYDMAEASPRPAPTMRLLMAESELVVAALMRTDGALADCVLRGSRGRQGKRQRIHRFARHGLTLPDVSEDSASRALLLCMDGIMYGTSTGQTAEKILPLYQGWFLLEPGGNYTNKAAVALGERLPEVVAPHAARLAVIRAGLNHLSAEALIAA